MDTRFLNRDTSWLSFNGRVLQEAMNKSVPLLERFKFLSIFSSNLDEFYRVRMPALLLFHEMDTTITNKHQLLLDTVNAIIQQQQQHFGHTLREVLIPELQQQHIELLYNKPIPAILQSQLKEYFLSEVLAFLEISRLSPNGQPFFAKSNALYQAVFYQIEREALQTVVVKIPSDKLPRFFSVYEGEKQYIIFLDDIVKHFLHLVFPQYTLQGAWNIKITRDAELDLADEYDGDLAEKIEKQLLNRDDGSATRFLYETGIPGPWLSSLAAALKLSAANNVEGGSYHNLKDLNTLPIKNAAWEYPKKVPIVPGFGSSDSVFENVKENDRVVHTPYQSYSAILKFFNEAATQQAVSEIYTTLYRVAGDSKIVHALITAAKNGKKVTVFIELKARFDEENNIRWAKKMKAAGVHIINSIPGLKVHAKVALVKRKATKHSQYTGLIATGNLNEVTAKFYTDHIVFTSHAGIVQDLKKLFTFLVKRRKPTAGNELHFEHLLVAQFNLQQRFIEMIDREIENAQQGKPAGIKIKMNNLEEKVLINKLYQASQAGVQVQLLVRSICCLAPGVRGQSDNISIVRIVDRYLEHGRVFIFTNGGDEQLYIGSSDWMKRNVYRRIEVCCPVYDAGIKNEIMQLVTLQLNDSVQAVEINVALDNKPVAGKGKALPSQTAIYNYLKKK